MAFVCAEKFSIIHYIKYIIIHAAMRFLVYYPTLKLLLNLAFIQEVHPLAEKVHAVLLLKKKLRQIC